MKYPELPVFAILSAILVLVPLPSQWRARNVATLALIVWLFVANVVYAINTLVWAGNAQDRSPVYCDIATKLALGASYAIPLITLCICKHLELVSSSRKSLYNQADRRRRMLYEIVMCIGVPLLLMALHFIVQDHRYDIFEDFGCQAAVYVSVPAIFLVWFPSLLFALVSFILAGVALHHFVRRRLVFPSHLLHSNSGLTSNQYLRLIGMAFTIIFWNTTITSYNLYSNVSTGLRPWSWATVHADPSRVDTFSAETIPAYYRRALLLSSWAIPASSIIFFLFFAFGEDSMKHYQHVGAWFSRTILRRPPTEEKIRLSIKPASSKGPRRLHLLDLKKANSSMGSLSISSPVPGSFVCTTAHSSTSTLAFMSPPEYTRAVESSRSRSVTPTAAFPYPPGIDLENQATITPARRSLKPPTTRLSTRIPSPSLSAWSRSSSPLGTPVSTTPRAVARDEDEYAFTLSRSPSSSSAQYLSAPSSSNFPTTYRKGSAASVETFASTTTVASRDKFYVVQHAHSHTPSPPPFATVFGIPLPVAPSRAPSALDMHHDLQIQVAEGCHSQMGMQVGYHRPFSPENGLPGIMVTVQTQSESSEDLTLRAPSRA
ncbi:pheromone receptor [Coprinopsis sp. MPI-PUGE-AT-0042]|nr:pheromone receptor [Coprinopsis sp. MPI-PUGE-AT-0042]